MYKSILWLLVTTLVFSETNWVTLNPLPQGSTLNAVVFANGRFVTVGYFGTIRTSSDGIHWSEVPRTVSNDLYGLIYANDLFVAVGQKGIIMTSPDGINWNRRISGVVGDLKSVSFGNGRFLILLGSEYLESNDGIEWRRGKNDEFAYINQYVSFGCRFFGVSIRKPDLYMSSEGLHWNLFLKDTLPCDTCRLAGSFIGISGDSLVKITQYTDAGVQHSRLSYLADGQSWTRKTNVWYCHLNSIASGNGMSVAVGRNGAVRHAASGVNWARGVSGVKENLSSVAFGNGIFVAVGDQGCIISSEDGASWTGRSLGVRTTFNDIALGNGRIVTVGTDGLFSSTDGSAWATCPNFVWGGVRSIAFGDGRFVMAGAGGGVCVSDDGVVWKEILIQVFLDHFGNSWMAWPDAAFTNIAYLNNQFVAVGERNAIWFSPDGYQWIKKIEFFGMRDASATPLLFNSAAYGLGKYIVVGNNGIALYSFNGNEWKHGTLLQDFSWFSNSPGHRIPSFSSVAFGLNRFVAVGDSGAVWSSDDGQGWVLRHSGTFQNLNKIVWSGHHFITVGNSGTLLTSTDGMNWVIGLLPTGENMRSMVQSGEQLLLVGSGGQILSGSTPSMPVEWKKSPSFPASELTINYLAPRLLMIRGIKKEMAGKKAVAVIYTITGREIFNSPVETNSGILQMRCPSLPSGVFLFGLKSANTMNYARFTVLH